MRTFEEIMRDLGHASNTHNADALLRYATELDELGTPQAAAAASNSRGQAHYLRGDHRAALEHYDRALTLHTELGNRTGVAGDTVNIGVVNGNIGDYPAALENFHRALALHEELGNRGSVANVTCNIGIVLQSTGDYPAALEHYYRALALFEELGHRSGVANVTANIGVVHKITGDYPAALERYISALALYEELGHRSGVASVKGNIGNVHSRTGDYSAALEHFHRALALHEELGERNGVSRARGSIVATYLAMGSDREAQELLQDMDAEQIDDPDMRIQREQHRATLQQRSGDLVGASATLQQALSEALEHGLRSEAADTHRSLRDLAQQRNDFAAYIEHNNEYTRITGEINGKDTATKLAMQEKQREIDAREKEHAKHMAVLHSTLPKHIADRVARGEVVNDSFDNAAVLFLDVVGFTTNSSELGANVLVELLQQIFTTFDAICAEHNVMKIKTIGDSYMAVAFPSEHHIEDLAAVALAMQGSVFTWPHTSERVMFRIGLHCGPVVAGVLGTERMQYDVWGDTVNVASRMESSGEAGRVHVSAAFAANLQSNTEYRIQNSMSESQNTESHEVSHASVARPSVAQSELVTRHLSLVTQLRGSFDIKGKGMMKTYWLESSTA